VIPVAAAVAAAIMAAAAVVDVLLAPHRRRLECHFKVFLGSHYCHKSEFSGKPLDLRFPYAIYHMKTAVLKS
jgi:hypothetical protein